MAKKLNVLILAGGESSEREVSLNSAKAVYEATQRLGYTSYLIDAVNGKSLLTADGRYVEHSDKANNDGNKGPDSQVMLSNTVTDQSRFGDIDLVFNALHGGFGENGTVQAILELSGVKYSGSSVMASAITMNKAFAKFLLNNSGIPTPNWKLIKCRSEEELFNHIDQINEKFRFPLIVKPNDGGSTVGLTLVKIYSDLKQALQTCFKVSHEILIEEYIKGREITAAVLDNENLPLVEIIPSGELYDYHCKYTKGGSQYICPAEIPDDVADKIKKYALDSYQMTDCSGLARIDFLLDEDNNPYFLEINTLPGMTGLSLAPMAAKVAGIDFDHLIERICQSALKK